MKTETVIEKKIEGKNEVLTLLLTLLNADIDSISDMERFLQLLVQTAATIICAKSSKLVLFREEKTEEPLFIEQTEEVITHDNFINVPLILRGLEHPVGYIEVRDRKDGQPFDLRDLTSVMMMGRQATLKIENDLFYRSIYDGMIEMLRSLVNILESRDPYIRCHSSRVTHYALKVGEDLKLSVQEMDVMKIASLLHDIGKVGIPDRILIKKGQLTFEEWEIIRTHSLIGENIIRPLAFLYKEKDIIRHHHECFDGSGYPDGLKGDEIPISARIIAVADSYDAMTTDRPYRPAKSPIESLEEIVSLKWIKYDPLIVQSFKKCIMSELGQKAGPAAL
ncbi:HD-GYP domain-containing protein [bacterium]|nr:HD-GYP domain-containing protein [bacterium]